MRNKKILVSIIIVVGCMQLAMADAPIVDYSVDANQDNSVTQRASTTKQPKPAKSTPTFDSSKAPSTSPLVARPNVDTSSMTLQQRVARLEKQVNNINQMNYQKRIDELQQQLQNINGQLEEQSYKIKNLQQQLQNYYKDLNNRIKQENHSTQNNPGKYFANPVITNSNKTKNTNQNRLHKKQYYNTRNISNENNVLKEQQAYQAAFNSLQNKKYQDSANKLGAYLKKYHNGIYAANAHYWLGEIYFLQKNPKKAVAEFSAVVNKHPSSTKVPEALLKLAIIHENEGNHVKAQKELNFLKKKYPKSAATKIAEQQLQ